MQKEAYENGYKFIYPVILTPDDGGYVVRFPDFPEAITQGKTKAESYLNANDCLSEAIVNRLVLELPVPGVTADFL